MKITKLFLVMLCSITVAACGGGSSSGSGSSNVTSGTAAQYFAKKAVGNKWAYTGTAAGTVTGTETITITASSSNAATFSDAWTPSGGVANLPTPITEQIDATGALITSAFGPGTKLLPATFSVGTTWVEVPGTTGTVVAFNVTRTVPGGTFTDCLQVTYVANGVTTTQYLSPSAGGYSVESISPSYSSQLQAGYIAL